MSIARFLQPHSQELMIFEREPRVGGHSHTIDVGQSRFDTGFMVYNEVTYPHLTKLFRELQVQTQPTDMSFSVRLDSSDLEYCGSSLNHLFAQRINLLRPRFWKLLLRIQRFNRQAFALLSESGVNELTLGHFIESYGFGKDFLEQFLIPMSSAVWSTPKDQMLAFPAHTLIRFFHNHGFLGLHTQHPWRTVSGGSRSYVEKLISPFRDQIRSGDAVVSIRSETRGSKNEQVIRTSQGQEQRFDQVILACHADESLRLLEKPTPREQELLQCFRYQSNPTIIHSDPSVMPKTALAWSSWNYRIDAHGRASTHYWMNRLQDLPLDPPYFVTLNDSGIVDSNKIHRRLNYTHPLFDLPAIQAQDQLPQLNREGLGSGRFYCGSYFKYGFHEDALSSSVALAKLLLGESFWS
ncbi:MAG: hypothetical protein RJB38_367 [Pseudomonadota bacterium]